MFISPSPSGSRGDIVLQPNYFTSSVYVTALRDDISTLILRYHEAFSKPECTKPFSTFKAVWLRMGWNWLHFKVFDSISRQTFLEVTARLFLERTVKTEAPFTRVVALFGMYVFYYTQIKIGAPNLLFIANIPIPCDEYATLMGLPDALAVGQVQSLGRYVGYVLSCLRKDKVFDIVPKSELGAMNPRELAREVIGENDSQKRKGRPSRREKGSKARVAVEELEKWVGCIT